jgi:UDP-N-acetylglucosamine 2-epimerase (non-hydrolysing)
MEETSVMMVKKSRTYYARIGTLALSKVGQERNFRPVADYSMPNVSEKMVAYYFELYGLYQKNRLERIMI